MTGYGGIVDAEGENPEMLRQHFETENGIREERFDMGLFGRKRGNRPEESAPKKQSSAVTAYQNEFRNMAAPTAGADDRAGRSDIIEMSGADIANTRFYGATKDRQDQMGELSADVEGKTGTSNVMAQTVDVMNRKAGITNIGFANPNLGRMRKMVMDAVDKTAPASDDEQVREWGKWLSESSRLNALFMPEMNSEVCRREMKLDKEAKESASDAEQVKTTEEEENIERIDHEQKRIFIGDKKRMDNLSNWINSGQTREIDGEPYEIYWTQESYGVDALQGTVQDNYHTWTPEMKAIHEESLLQETYEDTQKKYDELEEAAKDKYFWRNSEGTKKKAKAFRRMVADKTLTWVNKSIQNRFFRLTSLMGLDFFKKRGNTIQFARNIGQENYAGGGVNRVITDSEWAHAQRMGYTGAGGHVHRVNGADRFALSQ